MKACVGCGATMSAEEAFCTSCGASAPTSTVTPPPPPPPTAPQHCPSCGAVASGRRFCTKCGKPITADASAPPTTGQLVQQPTAQPTAAGEALKALSPLKWVVAGGFAVAALGTFLDWISFNGFGFSGWYGDGRFRIAEWIGVTAPIDALLVVTLAAGGAVALLAPFLGKAVPQIPYATAIAGGLIIGVAALQVYFILDIGGDLGSVGIGLWAIIVGGAAAGVLSYLEEQRSAGTR